MCPFGEAGARRRCIGAKRGLAKWLSSCLARAMKVYLAGPDVFLPRAMEMGRLKAEICAQQGLVALYPLDADLEIDWETAPGPSQAQAIFSSNREMIRDADAVLANLTPFRGPSADAGTVWEIGFAHALGKPVIGYSNVAAPFAARTRAFLAATPDGLKIEDFSLPSDNLMIHFALQGFFARDAHEPWQDLASFREAVARAARILMQ